MDTGDCVRFCGSKIPRDSGRDKVRIAFELLCHESLSLQFAEASLEIEASHQLAEKDLRLEEAFRGDGWP